MRYSVILEIHSILLSPTCYKPCVSIYSRPMKVSLLFLILAFCFSAFGDCCRNLEFCGASQTISDNAYESVESCDEDLCHCESFCIESIILDFPVLTLGYSDFGLYTYLQSVQIKESSHPFVKDQPPA